MYTLRQPLCYPVKSLNKKNENKTLTLMHENRSSCCKPITRMNGLKIKTTQQ